LLSRAQLRIPGQIGTASTTVLLTDGDLRRRHRRDDPKIAYQQNSAGRRLTKAIGASLATQNRKRASVPSFHRTTSKGILLVACDKSGGSENRFYRDLIRKADERFDAHIARLRTKGE
jgi:hypothetical protein